MKFIAYCRKINLFATVPPATDEHELKIQKNSTVVFIILLTLSIIILTTYTSFVPVTKSGTVEKPNLDTYKELYSKYPNTLKCPCKQVAVVYEKFLQINYALHQVCTSDFVSDRWLRYFSQQNGSLYYQDYRVFASQIFSSLRIICQSVNKTIFSSIRQFYGRRYITALITPMDRFESEIIDFVTKFISITKSTYLLSLNTTRKVTDANALAAGRQTNYWLVRIRGLNRLITIPYVISDCDCSAESTCTDLALFYAPPDDIIFSVPGMKIGCLSMEALLHSSLECFYNQACIAEFQSHINSREPMIPTPLDPLSKSIYLPITGVASILNELMVETWNWSRTYDGYYNECQPSECTYTYETRNSVIYVITTLLGLFGGLVTTLRFIVPKSIKILRRKRQPVTEKQVITIRQRIHVWLLKLKNATLAINLYSSTTPNTDEYEITNQRISTVLFIVLLILSTVILTLYTSLVVSTKTITVRQPTQEKYSELYTKYISTLRCHCSKISVNYKDLFDIKYTFHQVCNSDFISKDWIYYLASTERNYYNMDFRESSTKLFQSLSNLCELISTMISTSLEQFYSNQYVTALITPSEQYSNDTNTLVFQFISATKRNFLLTLKTIHEIAQANALLSAFQTNYVLYVDTVYSSIDTIAVNYGNCSCALESKCVIRASIYDMQQPIVLFEIPGMRSGCYPMEALSQSNLECFYNETCIYQFQSYITSSMSMTPVPLDSAVESKYSPSTILNDVINELMIETWNWSNTYKNYYTQCQPSACVYMLDTRNDIIYVVTTVIGLLGGLVKILHIFVPLIVRFIRKKFRNSSPQPAMNRHARIRVTYHQILHFIWNFNLFPSVPPTTDKDILKREQISTILFICLIALSLTILTLYTSLITVTKSKTIDAPTIAEYSDLLSKYSRTLTCPCTQISIEYETIFNITYTFHQVCTSDFVRRNWIDYLFSHNGMVVTGDFRVLGTRLFQSLTSFCHLAAEIISDGLTQFYSNKYITAFAISPDAYVVETNSLIMEFKSITINNFLISVQLIRDAFQANGLLSASQTNYHLDLPPPGWLVTTISNKYQNCPCAFQATCIDQAAVYNLTYAVLFEIPGMRIGCYLVESLLLSTLECFYSQTCITELQSYINSTVSISTTPLNSALSSRYSTNSTVQDMINNLMIETWNWSNPYGYYYNQCKPIECVYTYETKNDLIYTITTIIGLIGGLITALRLIISQIFLRILKLIDKRRKQRLTAIKPLQIT